MSPVSTTSSRLIYDALKSVRRSPDLGAARDVARASDPDGRRRPGHDARPAGERRRGRRDLGRRASRRREVRDADAESRLPRLDQRHRLVRAAVPDSAADADQPSRDVRRARSVADRGRRRDRARPARARHRVRPARRSRVTWRGGSRKAQTLAYASNSPVALLLVPRPDVGGAVHDAARRACSAIYPQLDDRVVVTIMGAVAAELQSIGHRPNFFYLQHAMGLASSTGARHRAARPDRAGHRASMATARC